MPAEIFRVAHGRVGLKPSASVRPRPPQPQAPHEKVSAQPDMHKWKTSKGGQHIWQPQYPTESEKISGQKWATLMSNPRNNIELDTHIYKYTYICMLYIHMYITFKYIYISPTRCEHFTTDLSRNCSGTYSWLEIHHGITPVSDLDCGWISLAEMLFSPGNFSQLCFGTKKNGKWGDLETILWGGLLWTLVDPTKHRCSRRRVLGIRGSAEREGAMETGDQKGDQKRDKKRDLPMLQGPLANLPTPHTLPHPRHPRQHVVFFCTPWDGGRGQRLAATNGAGWYDLLYSIRAIFCRLPCESCPDSCAATRSRSQVHSWATILLPPFLMRAGFRGREVLSRLLYSSYGQRTLSSRAL